MKRFAALIVATLVASCATRQPMPTITTRVPAATTVSTATTQDGGADIAIANIAIDEVEQVAAIEFAVNRGAPAVLACYKRSTAETLQVDGRIVLDIVFDSNGFPDVSIVQDDTGSKRLSACVAFVYRKFPWPPVFGEGGRIQLPLLFVSASEQFTISRTDVTRHEVSSTLAATVVLDADNTGNASAALSLLELTSGAQLPLGAEQGTKVLYVLQGRGNITGVREVKPTAGVTTGDVVYVPAGTTHVFEAVTNTELIQLDTPAGPEQRFEGRRVPDSALAVAITRTRASQRDALAPIVIQAASVPHYQILGGAGSVAILAEPTRTKDTAAYAGRLTMNPRMRIPEDVHAGTSEVLYIARGAAELTIRGRIYEVVAGMAVQVPPDTPHAMRVTSAEPLEAVQFYTPSGPEQRFKVSLQ